MNNVLMFIGLAIILIAAIIFIPQLMVKRAMGQVIKRFRQAAALAPESARTIEEMGLKPRSFFDRMMKTRDYKPQALQLMMRVEIVKVTPEGKVYLSEEKLLNTRWRGKT